MSRYIKLAFLVLSITFVSSVGFAEEDVGFWRLISEDNDALGKVPFHILEEMYGANLVVAKDRAPRKPKVVDGVVLHQKLEDDKYFMSKSGQNPGLDSNAYLKSIVYKMRELGMNEKFGQVWIDKSDDKMDEYRLLKLLAPNVAPPETHIVSALVTEPLSENDLTAVKAAVAKTMKKFGLEGKANEKKLTKAESLRIAIDHKMGTSILKERDSTGGSEGRLPRTNKDWLSPFAKFLKDGDHSTWVGSVIDEMIKKPENVVAQKMSNILHELRVHIVRGKILDDAIFLRMYHLNEYLTPDQIKFVKEALERDLLGALRERLGDDFEKLSATPDLALTKDGKIQILDLNVGIESGYFRPWEDMITASRLAEHFTGKKGPLLQRWEALLDLPMGNEKVKAMKNFFNRYRFYALKKVNEAYWDRIVDNYRQQIEKKPTPDAFAQGLEDFWNSGLRKPAIYLQYLNMIHDQVKDSHGKLLELSVNDQKKWERRLNHMDHKFEIVKSNGIFKGVEKAKTKPLCNFAAIAN